MPYRPNEQNCRKGIVVEYFFTFRDCVAQQDHGLRRRKNIIYKLIMPQPAPTAHLHIHRVRLESRVKNAYKSAAEFGYQPLKEENVMRTLFK